MKHCNIPIFIPHLGCPHQCVFCNQKSISGCSGFDESAVPEQIEQALRTVPEGADTEIAYFGGSFTGIDRDLMVRLLELAASYVRSGRVSSIRLSTRPDMVGDEILAILKEYPVRTVELGLQSMDDRVLSATQRGHTAEQAEDACRRVVKAGFSLVGQMMIGLPMADLNSELETARKICALGADACRIYPTVVFYGTRLAEQTLNGTYQPLNLDDAVTRSAEVLKIFLQNRVTCLRVGLCASEELVSEKTALGGANHPAIGELVWGELYYQKLADVIQSAGLLGTAVQLTLPKRDISKAVGQNRSNLARLQRETHTAVKKVYGSELLSPGEVQVAAWNPAT